MIIDLDVEEISKLFSSDQLSDFCLAFDLPYSGTKTEKIERLFNSDYADSILPKMFQWQNFVDHVDVPKKIYKEQCRVHGLPISGNYDDLTWRLIENLIIDPRNALERLKLKELRNIYYKIFNKISTSPSPDEIIQEILEKYELAELHPSKNEIRSIPHEVKPKCFVLMPFGPKIDPLYQNVIKPTVENANCECKRADDFFTANKIMDDIIQAIDDATFIIADLTDRNPNVFYEVGYCHAQGKKVIFLTQSKDDVTFDLRQWRLIVYQINKKGIVKLKNFLARTIETVK